MHIFPSWKIWEGWKKFFSFQIFFSNVKGLVFFYTSVGGWSNLETDLFFLTPPPLGWQQQKVDPPPQTNVQIIWTPLIPRPPPTVGLKKTNP